MPLNYYACFSFILRPPRELFLIACPPVLNRCMLLVLTRCSRHYSSQTYQLFPQYGRTSLPAVPASIPIKLTNCSPSMIVHPYPLFPPVFLSNLPTVRPVWSYILTRCSRQYSSQTYQLFPQYDRISLPAVPASIPLKLTNCLMGAQAKPLYSQMPLSRKPFRIGHMFI